MSRIAKNVKLNEIHCSLKWYFSKGKLVNDLKIDSNFNINNDHVSYANEKNKKTQTGVQLGL